MFGAKDITCEPIFRMKMHTHDPEGEGTARSAKNTAYQT